MKTTRTIVSQLVIAIVLAVPSVTFGAIIDNGDLTIIDDAGNASDGLRFLDMSYSDNVPGGDYSGGMTAAEALANAQATYANARLATPEEFDDLFAAAGLPESRITKFSRFGALGQRNNFIRQQDV